MKNINGLGGYNSSEGPTNCYAAKSATFLGR